MANTNDVLVSRKLLIGLLGAAIVGAALITAVAGVILIRAGLSVPLSRAITFPLMPLLLYPVLKTRAVMRQMEFSTPFWKWALVWSVLMFFSYLYAAPAIERMLE